MDERSTVRIIAHSGQSDESRLTALERRVCTLEQQYVELLEMLHRMTKAAAQERDLVVDRVRELELAQ